MTHLKNKCNSFPYQVLYFPPVGSDGQVCVDALFHVEFELGPVHPASQDVNVLLDDLHVGLEGNVAAGGALEHEPEICMTEIEKKSHNK